VPITSTIILQGGDERESSVLVPAEGGETLSAVPLKVPGGLVGIEFPGNFTKSPQPPNPPARSKSARNSAKSPVRRSCCR